jgi:hypothetical protein
MPENQSRGFAKRMTGFLAEKGSADSDVNTFLTYCLATLAHMHMAVGIPCDRTAAIGDIFQGKKAPMVLTLVINIVNVLASPEKKGDWEEKVRIIRMATVIANAVSNQVKVNGASGSDAAGLARLLEKAKAQEDTRVVSEVLQFVSALSLVNPPAPLKATIEELVCRNRKEETLDMFLPLISAGLFAVSPSGEVLERFGSSDILQKAASQHLVGDMLRSVIKRASANSEPTHSSYLLLRDRIEFIQKLTGEVQSPHLRRGVIAALSTVELAPLVDSFIAHTIKPSVASEAACGDGEACQWTILDLTHRLQLALCTFILRCSLSSHGDVESQPLCARTAISLMEKLACLSASRFRCPFETNPREKSCHDTLSLIEESASPEARISSRNWPQNLMERLARDTDRQHGFIVSTVSEICRDLERRCENVEKPLRAEEENSRRLQAEVDKLKMQCTDAGEQLARCMHTLEHTAGENDMLEKKLDCAIAKTKESMERIKELEETVEVEREEAGQSIQKLEQELTNTKASLEKELANTNSLHFEELKAVRDAANQAAMEHIAVLNSRQEIIDQLQEHNRRLEQETGDAKDEISLLREEKSRLEANTENLRQDLVSVRQGLGESKGQLEMLRVEYDTLSVDKLWLEKNKASLEKSLAETSHALERYKTLLVQKIRDSDRQDQIIDVLDYQKRRQKEQICHLERARDQLDARVQELQDEMETAIQDGEERRENVVTELEHKHKQEVYYFRPDSQQPSLTPLVARQRPPRPRRRHLHTLSTSRNSNLAVENQTRPSTQRLDQRTRDTAFRNPFSDQQTRKIPQDARGAREGGTKSSSPAYGPDEWWKT